MVGTPALALKVHSSTDFPAAARPKDIALTIFNQFRRRQVAELDRMTLDIFLQAYPKTTTYGVVGILPNRFVRFREEKL